MVNTTIAAISSLVTGNLAVVEFRGPHRSAHPACPWSFGATSANFDIPKKKCSWQGLFPNLVIPTFWQVSSSIFKYHVYLDRTINFLTSETSRRWIPKEPAYLERSFTTCITQRLIHILLLVGHVPIVNLFPISVEFVLILLLVLESQLIPVFAL